MLFALTVLRYVRGSKELGIDGGSYAQVVCTDPKENVSGHHGITSG